MEWFDRAFAIFMTFVAPFMFLDLSYRSFTKRPRTRSDLFWGLFSGLLSIWGLINLMRVLLTSPFEPVLR